MQEFNNLVAINIQFLTDAYFTFDKDVPYELKCGKIVWIKPIKVIDSILFFNSVGVISQDKNSIPDPKIIQMSYLDFIINILLQVDTNNGNRLAVILKYCLGIQEPKFGKDERGKYFLVDTDNDIKIMAKEFEDIRRIILYQNIFGFDDEYMNPELKQAMMETDALRHRGIDMPDLERKFAIITAHCGISKREQIDMTLRSHNALFNEVCGEVEFETTRAIAMFAGKGKEMEHWIYKKKKNKLDGYVTSIGEYQKMIGQ